MMKNKISSPTWYQPINSTKIVEQGEEMTDEVEKTLERLQKNRSVQELLFFDKNGLILRSTVDAARGQIYRNTFRSLSYVAQKTVKNMDPNDDLKFIRMRTKGTEIIIAPDHNGTLAVLQSVSPYDPPYRPPKKETLASLPFKTCLFGTKKKDDELEDPDEQFF